MERSSRIVVRPAGPDDALAVASVREQTWRASLAHLLPPGVFDHPAQDARRRELEAQVRQPERDQRFLVAVAQGTVAGFVWFGRRPHELPPYQAMVHSLYVAPDRQRDGIGGRLLEEAAAELHRMDVGSMMLWVLKGNEAARRFYERRGGTALPSVRPFRIGVFSYPSYPMMGYGWDRLPGLLSDRRLA